MEQAQDYYNNIYLSNASYHSSAQNSIYYKVWDYICLNLNEHERIFDLGCGVGQFASLLIERNKNYAMGIDFSEIAIEKAIETNKVNKFCVGDLYDHGIYNLIEYDTVLICEVLEHIDNDFFILEQIPAGKRIIFTVPNFAAAGHVRLFDSMKAVYDRYSDYIDRSKTNGKSFLLKKDKYIHAVFTVKK